MREANAGDLAFGSPWQPSVACGPLASTLGELVSPRDLTFGRLRSAAAFRLWFGLSPGGTLGLRSPDPNRRSWRFRSDRGPLATLNGIVAVTSVEESAIFVALFEQEPMSLARLAVLAAAADQHPASVQLFAVQREFQAALAKPFSASPTGSHVPRSQSRTDPPPYSPCGNDAFEVSVFDRVIFNVHRQSLDGRIQRRALRHRPTHQHAAEFQSEVIVQVRSVVFLNHEAEAIAGAAPTAARFGRDAKIALLAILSQSHSCRPDSNGGCGSSVVVRSTSLQLTCRLCEVAYRTFEPFSQFDSTSEKAKNSRSAELEPQEGFCDDHYRKQSR